MNFIIYYSLPSPSKFTPSPDLSPHFINSRFPPGIQPKPKSTPTPTTILHVTVYILFETNSGLRKLLEQYKMDI